jgi:hypothetical protein
MAHPVVAADGHTYERSAISAWLAAHGTSPLTRAALPSKALVPNLALRRAAAAWLECRRAAGEQLLRPFGDEGGDGGGCGGGDGGGDGGFDGSGGWGAEGVASQHASLEAMWRGGRGPCSAGDAVSCMM